jgi:SAM-dependent methyltransferase
MTLFVSSFLVLFLEIALIRWMPAYVRLLAYFSNFILLATFLGGGLGCLLANRRRSLVAWFPLAQLIVIIAVDRLRLEVAVPASSTNIYFTSGTAAPVVSVESTMLLPLLFVIVALLFLTVAQRMGRELTRRPPLQAYTINLLGSITGVVTFALLSWLELPPVVWFGVAFAAALPFLVQLRPDPRYAHITDTTVGRDDTVSWSYVGSGLSRAFSVVNVLLLLASLFIVYRMEGGSLWSPYYRITLFQDGPDTVVEVNNIFHQSMAPVEKKEYFYQWPYTVFGDTFEDVLILGAGTGTDVAAALRHGARHVDAVEIDPVILRLGAEHHPDHPYSDPRVRAINDDARHYLATTDRKYDLIVFALIDSLTVQSSFSSVRLESYMFTDESFRAVRDHLKPRGVMALYNYFREKWLVDRLANTVSEVFGQEPLGHVHQERAYLAVMLAGPRLAELTVPPPLPKLVLAYGQSQDPSPAQPLHRDPTVIPATDNWPFLYMRAPELPRHYLAALAVVLVISLAAVSFVVRGSWFLVRTTNHARRTPHDARRTANDERRTAAHFFFLGAGFMLLETKSIVQFALLWGSTWSSASLAIVSVLVMALVSAFVASRVDIHRRWPIVATLVALLALNYVLPIGRVAFGSRAVESLFYGMLVFSPVLCAGLLFSTSYKQSSSTASDFGANLFGAMVGGVCEYFSLLTGYQFLLVLVAGCYLFAVTTSARGAPGRRTAQPGV